MKINEYDGTEEEKRALSAFVKLIRSADSLSARVHSHLAREKLTVSQFGVLEALYHLGPLSQGDVARRVLKTSGNMTLVVDNLVRRGLLTRNRSKEDRRFYRLSLTPKGKEIMDRLFPRHAENIVREMSILSGEEQEEISRLCRAVGLQCRAAEEA